MADETIVVGSVRDATTGMPIENANVWYKNTDTGCATNAEGMYMVRTDLDKKRTLIVSAVGYKKQKFQIEPGQYVGIEVELEEQNTVLQDVFIVPGENPALALMEQVRSRRQENDVMQHAGVSYTRAEQKSLFISDIRQKHLQRLLWRSLQSGMFTAEDSTLVLPLYYSRSESRMTGGVREEISSPEEKSVMLTDTDYRLLLEGLPEYFDFYRNTLSVFGKSFISPLASSGNSHYKYYLADSISADSIGKTYTVHFRSKNPYEPSFNGEMQIDSATMGIRSISVSVPREVGLNYLTSLRVNQTYDETLCPTTEKLSMIFDFAIKADTSHVFPTVLLKRDIQTTATSRGTAETAEAVRDTVVENQVDSALVQLENSVIFRLGKTLAHIINTGNIPTGEKVDIGNAVELLGGSRQEGFHLGIPLTTNEKLWKNVELSGYVAYGFRDRALKGKGQIRVLLPAERRHLIGAWYWDHYAKSDLSEAYFLLRENDIFYADQDFAHMVFGGIRYQNQAANTETRKREFRVWMENEWTDNVETKLSFSMGRMGYGSPYVGYHNISSYRFRTLQASVRLGWQEKKIDFFMRRYRVRSTLPVVRLVAEAGTWQLDKQYGIKEKYYDGANLYARLTVQLQQTVSLGMMGRLDYALQAGMVFGEVPYPLLEHFVGNQSYTYDPYRFTLMNSYQYAADRFVYAHVHWNMQGVLFNRIPFIQRLHLRELVEAKIAYGTLSSKHREVVEFPDGMGQMRVPYAEAGIGIGNILRVADVYAVFRLSDFKNTATPWWGIRARFSLGL
ncbi:MAG: carboxypeptidase-like regulatory domain-containing protein [Paludibacteraceae bacterium]|nr:carboxypeptidase-like regulatory domain-containing protein [Paludibacteraceae bacterium]